MDPGRIAQGDARRNLLDQPIHSGAHRLDHAQPVELAGNFEDPGPGGGGDQQVRPPVAGRKRPVGREEVHVGQRLEPITLGAGRRVGDPDDGSHPVRLRPDPTWLRTRGT